MNLETKINNPSNKIRQHRPDLTPYLFHFTSGSNPIENIKSILNQRKLESDKGYICFTDTPLSTIGEQLKYMNQFSTPMYSQFGIGFIRDRLITQFGCRPVIYGDKDELNYIDSFLHWRYEYLDISNHDFTWLREWRINGNTFDFSQIDLSDIMVIAPTEEELSNIIEDIDVDIDFEYDHCTRKSFPYQVYTIKRKWKGIPLSQAETFSDDNKIQDFLEIQKIGEEIK